MSRSLRAELRHFAERAVAAGTGAQFVTVARQELAAAASALGTVAASARAGAAAAAGMSERSLRRHLRERREAEEDVEKEAVFGAPAENAMVDLRLEARRLGGAVPRATVLEAAKRHFPGSPQLHQFMLDVWVDIGWLLRSVHGGYSVAAVTSSYQTNPTPEAMAAVRASAHDMLDSAGTGAPGSMVRMIRVAVPRGAPTWTTATAVRRVAVDVLTSHEQRYGADPRQVSAARTRRIRVALVGAFGAELEQPRDLAVWAEAKATCVGTPDFISVLTTDPLLAADSASCVGELLDQLERTVGNNEPAEDNADLGHLLVVACDV